MKIEPIKARVILKRSERNDREGGGGGGGWRRVKGEGGGNEAHAVLQSSSITSEVSVC